MRSGDSLVSLTFLEFDNEFHISVEIYCRDATSRLDRVIWGGCDKFSFLSI